MHESNNESLDKAIRYLLSIMHDSLELEFSTLSGYFDQNIVILEYIAASDFPSFVPGEVHDESYTLIISADKILINAPKAKGIFYGCISLSQLIQNSEDGYLPAYKIIDWPDSASLDVTSIRTYEFLENLPTDVFSLFPSRYVHIGADEIYDHIIFKENFSLNSVVLESQLQFLADSHARLFINDNFADEVYVRTSGSLWTEKQRVKILEVNNLFLRGSNEIKSIVRNYKIRNASAN